MLGLAVPFQFKYEFELKICIIETYLHINNTQSPIIILCKVKRHHNNK